MQTHGLRLRTRTPVVLELERGRVLWVSDEAGVGLICHAGCLWVTEGDDRDQILQGGDSLVVGKRERALVHALDDARFTMCPPSSSGN